MKPGGYVKDRVVVLMTDGNARTQQQIVDALDTNLPSVRAAIAAMHGAGLVHITDWEYVANGRHQAIYVFGQGSDAKQRKVPTQSERMKAYRHKAGERKRRERIEAERTKPAARDPFVAALFGSCAPQARPTALPSRVYRQPMDVADDELEVV